nr:systemin receptor SR160 [Ipomoea batatas]
MDPPGREVDEGGATIRLQSLDLSYNNISGQNIFVMLYPSDFPDLELLSLKGNKLSGKIWELSFRNLSYLGPSANAFSEKFPSFQGCSSLQHLDFIIQQLQWDSQQLLSFKASIFNQSPLQNWVSSSINPCSFTGITCKGSRVSSINLTNTMLSIDFGLVSSFLHNLENLESLVLKNTNLSGNIPELSFKVLSYLDLSDNNFTENFPSFQDCSSLQHLDLSSNSFSGNIDASLSSCYKLRFLNLSNNMFGGGVAKLPSGKPSKWFRGDGQSVPIGRLGRPVVFLFPLKKKFEEELQVSQVMVWDQRKSYLLNFPSCEGKEKMLEHVYEVNSQFCLEILDQKMFSKLSNIPDISSHQER